MIGLGNLFYYINISLTCTLVQWLLNESQFKAS